MPTAAVFAAATALTATLAAGQPTARVLYAELDLDAPLPAVWELWATEAGLKSFFAPGARVDPHVDGAYEIHFSPEKPAGEKGAEGTRLLVVEPGRRLVFTWNAPPAMAPIRAQRTVVEVRLTPLTPSRTRLAFTHSGWGEGPEWDAAYAYFDDAWRGFVLPMLQHRVMHGPVDWSKPPAVQPLPGSMTRRLRVAP